jgi:hypothetical protein
VGLIGRVLGFVRLIRNDAQVSDVQTAAGGGENTTAEHFGAAGDDSPPLPGIDYVWLGNVRSTGRMAAMGYVDPLNVPQAQPGERRLYSRDGAGAPIGVVWLKSSGEIVLSNDAGDLTLGAGGAILGQNAAGSFELQPGGDFVINGVTITAAGVIIAPTSLQVGGKELAAHTHAQAVDSGGDTQQNTGPNL